jgi:hypothetical protein
MRRGAWLALLVVLSGCGSSDRDGSSGGAGAGGFGFGGSGRGGSGAGGSAGTTIIDPEGGEGGVPCRREVTLTAVTIEEPPPFDLVIVADHSDSLAWSRDELSAGLGDLLDNVKGRSVRVFLLTPTQYGASSEPALMPLSGDPVVSWRDPTTGEAFPNAMTIYEQACTDPLDQPIACPGARGPEPYKAHGTWRFDMPDPIAVITPELTDEEFADAQVAVADAILSIGGGGSPEEQPLCTLGRYLSQAADELPGHAVFLLISDEDDVSRPDDCLVEYDAELRVTETEIGTTPCSANCDAYRYSMLGVIHWQRLEFRCAAVDDLGEPIPGTEMTSWLNEAGQSSCDGFPTGTCTAAEAARAGVFCDSGLTLYSCERQCATRDSECRFDFATPVDACNRSFSLGGTTYDNLADYCATQGSGWGACSGGGIIRQTMQQVSGTYDRVALVEGTATADLTRFVSQKAANVFGPDRHLFEAIALDPTFDCEVGTGQSYATNLAELIANPAKMFPLCEAYAPALEGVWAFARDLVQTEFPLTMADDEDVTAVVVTDANGAERTLGDGDYSYDRESEILTVARAALSPSDVSLRVEVTSACRPIVR